MADITLAAFTIFDTPILNTLLRIAAKFYLNVTGWKLVMGKRGSRQWEDADKAEAALKAMRLKVDDMYTKNLKTPPAMEKFFKTNPKQWAKVATLIVQPDGKPGVAPASDPRPVWVKPDVSADFADAEGNDLV